WSANPLGWSPSLLPTRWPALPGPSWHDRRAIAPLPSRPEAPFNPQPSAVWAGEDDRHDVDPVKPAVGTTRVIQRASQRGSLMGTRPSDVIMASGPVPRATGRTHE